MVGYGKRWAVKTAFSTFKRIFDDYCIAKELEIKAFVYATIINLTLKTKRQTRNND